MRLLLEAAPDTAALQNAAGQVPLQVALANHHAEAASLLVAAGPADSVLQLLRSAPARQQRESCVPAFVRAHLPLTDEQWQQLSGIGMYGVFFVDFAKALPAALEHSSPQARQLVRLLAHDARACLRTFGLCLARVQRHLHLPLPGLLVGKIMALIDA